MVEESKSFIAESEVKQEIRDFKDFAFKKNILELTAAVIIGNSFNKVIASLSENLIMPIVNAILSHTGHTWREATWKASEHVTIEYGKFLSTSIDFLITTVILYILFMKMINPIWKRLPGNKKEESKKIESILINI